MNWKITLIALLGLAGSNAFAAANPQVQIDTNMGSITVELYPEKAPQTVSNFLHYAKSGYYNGTSFHRVINDFMIQGGGYSPALEPKEPDAAPIRNEAANGLQNDTGTLAMARSNDPDSATSQFFINLDNNLHLNRYENRANQYGYCVFGKVVKGLDVAKKIGSVPVKNNGIYDNVPLQPIVIEKVALLETPEPAIAPSKPVKSKKPLRKSKVKKTASAKTTANKS